MTVAQVMSLKEAPELRRWVVVLARIIREAKGTAERERLVPRRA